MGHHFEIYKDKAGEFRVRFSYNSEVMFSTQGYSSFSSAENAVASIKRNGPSAPVHDNASTYGQITKGEPINPVALSEQALRDAHREGYKKAKRESPHYKGGYHRSFFDFSEVRAKYGFGPRGR